MLTPDQIDTIMEKCRGLEVYYEVQALAADLIEARRLLAIKDAALKPFAAIEPTSNAVLVYATAVHCRAAARALRGEP